MTKEDRSKSPGNEAPSPRRIRLPGFIADQEIGLGDVVKRATSYVGVKPCRGCAKRAETLNRWMVFTPGKKGE